MESQQQEVVTPVQAALSYAARGWLVFPCHSIVDGHCTCSAGIECDQKPGKHPRTEHGHKDATTNVQVIQQWWRRWPTANIGIATGRGSNLAVLDVDPKHDGPQNLAILENRHGGMPFTVEVITGSGGQHYYFTYPSTLHIPSSVSKLGAGLDIRGDGGYIIAPPSLHLSGRSYEWELSPPSRRASPCSFSCLGDSSLDGLSPKRHPFQRGEATFRGPSCYRRRHPQ